LFLITRNLPPLRGGMERLNARMAGELAVSYDVTVFAPKGSRCDLGPGTTLRAAPVDGVAMFLLWSLLVVPIAALQSRPSWILGGSGLVAPVVRAASLLSRARSALYLHGLDIVVDHPVYRHLWLPLIRHVQLCVTNSRNTARLAGEAGVVAEHLAIVRPGVELPSDETSPFAAGFRVRHALGEGPLLLSVGRLTARKGLGEFVEHGFAAVLAEYPDAMLLVIGDEAPDALATRHGAGRQQVTDAARRLGVERNICFLGPVDENELRAAYEASDLHLFPVKDLPGDVEGFGMVAIESAAHGLPTVAFASGGVPDAVAEGVSGRLVEPNDYAGLAQASIDTLRAGRGSFAEGARAFAAGFAWPRFGQQLRAALLQAEKS
jgi:phosphatidylinositol alpha-1,6-mannosyltransferase